MRIWIALAGLTASIAHGEPTNDRWLDRQEEGWFWYEQPPPEPEPKKEPEPTPQASTTPAAPAGPPPLSAAWIRENIGKYLEAAIDDPTPKNVAAYLYIQRYAMDKSFAFMDATETTTLGNPDFDEINRRPTATFANRNLDATADQNRKQLIEEIGQKAGLFLFTDSSPASQAQLNIFEMFNKQFAFDSITISVTPLTPEQQAAGVRQDNGHAEQFGISSFPAIALLRGDGLYDVVTQAPVSLPDLQRRVLIGAKRLGVVTEDQYNETRHMKGISNMFTSLGQTEEQSQSRVPIAPEEIIAAFGGNP